MLKPQLTVCHHGVNYYISIPGLLLMAIPNNPSLNEEWTNDVTGVTYKWDGERWYIVSTSDADLEENYVTKTDFIDDQQRQDDVIESISGE